MFSLKDVEEKIKEVKEADGTRRSINRGGNSFSELKYETLILTQQLFPNKNIKILDVGPGAGVYQALLGELLGYQNIDCVEIFKDNIEYYNLKKFYKNVYNDDIVNFNFEYYDLIIMGDILEHIKPEVAIKLVENICKKCACLLVQIPYKYEQDEEYNNKWEKHEQGDLTHEIFLERYPMMSLSDRKDTFFGNGTGLYFYINKNMMKK